MNQEERVNVRVKEELDAINMKEKYDQYLNYIQEENGDIIICGITLHIDAASLLQEQAPTDYRCGFADWLDSELREGEVTEIDNEYYKTSEVEEIESDVELETEVEEIDNSQLGVGA